MRYEFHPEALAEYREAAYYYARCQPGLEHRFISAVEHAIGQINAAPEQWLILEDDVRRCLTRVFPYAVLYSIEPDFFARHRRDALPPAARLLASSPRRKRMIRAVTF